LVRLLERRNRLGDQGVDGKIPLTLGRVLRN
jgi:hypothetical protein